MADDQEQQEPEQEEPGFDEPKWTYDPQQLNDSPKDQVRFLIGDVLETEPLVEDAEIFFALSQNGNIYMAAAMVCDSIAAMFSRQVDRVTGDKSDKFSQRSAQFAERAKELRAEAASKALSLAKPLVGGIKVSQKETAEQDTNRVKPFFVRNQFGGRY